ncbi:MAG: glycosyltransferase family 29 protein [Pirellulales bacterium]
MKLRWPGLVRRVCWRLHASTLDVRPWCALADELPNRCRIAIVGNAGYLADADLGEQIDSCDLVVRMNNFQLRGFERSIGRRTDVFITNFSRSTMSFDNPHARAARWIVSSRPMNFRRRRDLGVPDRLGEHVSAGMSALGASQVFVPSLEYFAAQVGRFGTYPTTGMMALQLAIDVLAPRVSQLFLAGFSFFQGRSHYFSDRTVDAALWHNVDGERQAFRDVAIRSAAWIQVDPIMQKHLETEACEHGSV